MKITIPDDDNGNGAITKDSKFKITLGNALTAVGLLLLAGFTASTYLNNRNVQAEAIVDRIEGVADEVDDAEKEIANIKEINDGQDEEIVGIREGIGFIKGQLSTLITQLDDIKTQNRTIIKAARRRP